MFTYPYATVSQIRVPDAVWWELERRLVLVFLGKTHNSSAVHQKVIADLEDEGSRAPRLSGLRHMAVRSRDALYAGDFTTLGRAMVENTELQATLHPSLIGREARELIALCQQYDVLGWKVNGAGGEGGSLTLLCGTSDSARRSLLRTIVQANPLFKPIPISLCQTGLRLWDSPL
jgi:D-glycero-alpha-D-manno-heptose-7-phosphate kinase